MLLLTLMVGFGAMYITLSSSANITLEGSNITTINNKIIQDRQTDQVLRELSAQLADVNSVTELYNMMVRYNHQYCAPQLLRDLEKNSKSKAEKVALDEMKRFCEQVESQHDLRSRALAAGKTSSNPNVIAQSTKQLQTIIKRSKDHKTKCRVKKMVIELPTPPPGSIYYPRCTTLKRCSGCCKNPLQTCVPAFGKIKLVKRKVLMIQKLPNTQTSMFIKELKLEQHMGCECACPIVNSTSCGPMQEFSEHNCSCKCKNENIKHYCFHPRSWNSIECKCQCPPSLGCTSGQVFDEQTCKCISLSVLKHTGSRGKESNQVVK